MYKIHRLSMMFMQNEINFVGMKVAIIGGGAAGFFSALSCAEHYPKAKIVLFEKDKDVLHKVHVSGGGRCNVTNACNATRDLIKNYPRGDKALKKVFPYFSTKDTFEWFENRGVKLKIESDNRVFPESNQSSSIVNCLMNEVAKHGIELHYNTKILEIKKEETHFCLKTESDTFSFTHVIVTTGGSPNERGLKWLEDLGHSIVKPVPSLFTFNLKKNSICELMGVSVNPSIVWIEGFKMKSDGSLLITHWGLSGPAVLKLSAFAARYLYDCKYLYNVHVCWSGESNDEIVKERLLLHKENKGLKNILKENPFEIPSRLWKFLVDRAKVDSNKRWIDLSKKEMNQLLSKIQDDMYEAKGKTTFKEEFVTCGGVNLNSVSFPSMESKHIKNLYFAGEVLDIDGVTGGFNFQAAWSCGYMAGKLGKLD